MKKTSHVTQSCHRIWGSRCVYTYQIPASESLVLLEMIRELQKDLIIPQGAFTHLIGNLQEGNYLSSSKAREWLGSILTEKTLDECEKEVQKSKHSGNALVLARFFLNKNKTKALFYLCKACDYNPAQFHDRIDLPRFFRELETICYFDVFSFSQYRAILDEMARCSSITSITFSNVYYSDSKHSEKVAAFLRLSPHIQTFTYHCRCVNPEILSPIAQVLSENRSLKTLDLSFSPIGDEGVEMLCKALESNPNTQVSKLILSNCQITEKGATRLEQLFQRVKTLSKISLPHNSTLKSQL